MVETLLFILIIYEAIACIYASQGVGYIEDFFPALSSTVSFIYWGALVAFAFTPFWWAAAIISTLAFLKIAFFKKTPPNQWRYLWGLADPVICLVLFGHVLLTTV